MVPETRIAAANQQPIRADGDYVLYWMIAARRTSWNFALDRAREHADALGKPLVIFEPLRVDYRWASDRLHRFALDGMRDNSRACHARGVTYFPYIEGAPGEGKGLLDQLAAHAAVVVTDVSPGFFLPAMTAAAARTLTVRLEAVDGNGLLPLHAVNTAFPTAYAFRRVLQRLLPQHVHVKPQRDPLSGTWPRAAQIPAVLQSRWRSAAAWIESGDVSRLPIDHAVPAAPIQGGERAARARLREFVDTDLDRYGIARNQPDDDTSSRLSPYLHWGHLSVHEVFDSIVRREGWLGALPSKATGKRDGWWGLSRSAECFLDELIVWRELGFIEAQHRDGYDRFDALPSWARATLEGHADDERHPIYAAGAFEDARTHDGLWNAAQRQLRTEGRIHNYLRMLWGKKILEWSASPREAVEIMVHLNNKYALDGRDPNSYSGIFWALGRYDRPWFPERPVFGTVRYMSSENTARKLRVRKYLARYAGW